MGSDPTSRPRPRFREVTVDVARQGAARRVPVRGFKAKARRLLGLLGQADCELSVALVGDDEIRRLNARFRSRDEPTDVLSFPLDEPLPSGRRLVGDVVISVEKAARQARQRRRSLDDELEALLIHGILHNLGYDHERSPEDEREMRAMERRLRRALRDGGTPVAASGIRRSAESPPETSAGWSIRHRPGPRSS